MSENTSQAETNQIPKNSDGRPDHTVLLDENGNFDASKIHKYTNSRENKKVSKSMCDRMSRVLVETHRSIDSEQIADAFGIAASTVRHHAKGNCSHTKGTYETRYEYAYGWHYTDDPVIPTGVESAPDGKLWIATGTNAHAERHHSHRCRNVRMMRAPVLKTEEFIEWHDYELCDHCAKIQEAER